MFSHLYSCTESWHPFDLVFIVSIEAYVDFDLLEWLKNLEEWSKLHTINNQPDLG